MLILIIFIVLILIGITLLVYNYFKDNDVCLSVGLTLTFFGSIASVALGIIACVTNSYANCQKNRIEYEQKVIQLNNTYRTLIDKTENFNIYTAIEQYNTQVAEFKSKIMVNQDFLNNPWTNWLFCKEFKNMDANAVQYIIK